MSDSLSSHKVIDPTKPPKVEYCIPVWLRDEQVKLATERNIPRLEPSADMRSEPIACVGFGPSLNDTWEQIKDFKYVMSCSGAHKFLTERGIIPTHHLEVDPRAHKVGLIGTPNKETNYLIASACHPDVFDHLADFNVTLWHVFDGAEESQRILPANEWAITGGCSVGVRMLTISRFLGFRQIHVFGMDGSQDSRGKHAAFHPSQPKGHAEVTVHDRTFQTTASMYAVAEGIWHEIDILKDCEVQFYGDGLIQHMAKFYERKPVSDEAAKNLGMAKPQLISAEYRELNRQLHKQNIFYGIGGNRHAETVKKLTEKLNTTSVLDYGCGKGFLAKELPFPIWEYDPAIAGKDQTPRPADIVICTDVLEHIEPAMIGPVLNDLKRVVLKVGYFTIYTKPAQKTLPDGRNTHLIQQDKRWWKQLLEQFFVIGRILQSGPTLTVVVGPKPAKARKAA